MAFVKKTFKILTWLCIILVLVFALGVFVLVKWVNPNSFKPELITAVENATGRTLSLPGDLSWSFYPYLGIHIGAAALSNPSGFSQSHFAEIDSADLAINVMDLLQGHIVFDRLNLNGLRLFLIEQAHTNNWTFKAGSSLGATKVGSKPSKQSHSFTIHALNIESGSVDFANAQTKSHYVVNNINFTANELSLGASFPLTMSAGFDLNQTLHGSFKLATQLNFNPETEILQLANLALQTSIMYPREAGEAMNILSQYSATMLQLNFAQQSLSIPSFNFVINQGVKGSGMMRARNLFTAATINGQLNTNTFSLNDFLNSLGVNPPNIPNKTLLDQVQLASAFSFTAHAKNSMLSLNQLAVSVGASHLQGSLNLSWLPFNLTERLTVDQLDLADFINLQGASLPLTGLSTNASMQLQNFPAAVFPRTLNASINLQIQNILLKGFDLHAMVQNLQTLISSSHNLGAATSSSLALQQELQGAAPQGKLDPNNGQSTNLGALQAKINIDRGFLTTPLMNLQGPEVAVTGSGHVDLSAETVNYQLLAKIIGSDSSFIKSLSIPYVISGTFANLTQGINWTAVNAQILAYLAKALTGVVQNVVTTAVSGLANGGQSVGSAVKDGAVKALNSIFGGAP